jgi:hypothetical protein
LSPFPSLVDLLFTNFLRRYGGARAKQFHISQHNSSLIKPRNPLSALR